MIPISRITRTHSSIILASFLLLVFLSMPTGASAQSSSSQLLMSNVEVDVVLDTNGTSSLTMSANVTNRGLSSLGEFDVRIDIRSLTLNEVSIDSLNVTATVIDAERYSVIRITPVASIPSQSSVQLVIAFSSDILQEEYGICDERNLCLQNVIYYVRPLNEFSDFTYSITLPQHAILDSYTNPIYPTPTFNHTDGDSLIFTWETGPILPGHEQVFIVKYGIPVALTADIDTTMNVFLIGIVAALGGAIVALGVERIPKAIGAMKSRQLVGTNGSISKHEREVVQLLSGKDGSCLQREIYENLDMSQSMVSMLLTGLEERGLIRRLREGRENIVHLVEE